MTLISIFSFYHKFFNSVNPFPNKPWFLCVCRTSLLKTLWEKEKLLVTSNFSFSHSVFYPFRELSAIFIQFEIVVCELFQLGRVLNLSFGKGLNASFITVATSKLSSANTQVGQFYIFMPRSSLDRGHLFFALSVCP